MIETLITSKTRVKLLIKFFLNAETSSYLRELAANLNENTNAVRVELNRLTDAGILLSERKGNKVFYRANRAHIFFKDIQSIVSKYTGLDRLLDEVVGYLGDLKRVYVIGDYANGNDSGTIELLMTGDPKLDYLSNLIDRMEQEISRKIKCKAMSVDDATVFLQEKGNSAFLIYDGER
ncbi:MAG: ArsR family transcriptional regulator [Brumimicrobium sp.]